MAAPDSRGAQGTPAAARLARGAAHFSEGRLDAALLEFAGVRSESGGGVLAGLAWERIAEVHERRGDHVARARALLKARDLADTRAKSRITPSLEAALAGLTAAQRASLSRSSVGAGLAPEASSPGVVRMTLLAPLSGRFENFGRAFRLGAEIALEQRRAASPSIDLAVTDTAGDAVQTSVAARGAILERGSAALLGPLLSVPTIACAAIADAHRVPLVTPAVSEPRLAEMGSAVQVLVPTPEDLARVLADAAVGMLGVRRIAVLTPGDPVSAARAEALEREAAARGGAVVATVAYPSGSKDLRAAFNELRKTEADAVYILGEAPDLETIAGLLDGATLGRRVLGNGEWGDAKLRRFTKGAIEGAVFALEAGEAPDSDFSRRLAELVRARSGGDLSRFHVFGYETMDEVLAAIDRGARDADEILAMFEGRAAWETPPAGRVLGAWTVRGGVLQPLESP